MSLTLQSKEICFPNVISPEISKTVGNVFSQKVFRGKVYPGGKFLPSLALSENVSGPLAEKDTSYRHGPNQRPGQARLSPVNNQRK